MNTTKLKLIGQILRSENPRRVMRDTLAELAAAEQMDPLLFTEEVGNIFRDLIGNREDERFAVIFVNQAREPIGKPMIFEGGSRTRTVLYPRLLFKEALARDATGIYLSHNHPSGTPIASPEDKSLTYRVKDLGESLEVKLIDHFIVTKKEVVSLAQCGLV